MARESVSPAFLAVDDAHRGTHDKTGLTGGSDRFEEGSAGCDDVLDEAHGLPRVDNRLILYQFKDRLTRILPH